MRIESPTKRRGNPGLDGNDQFQPLGIGTFQNETRHMSEHVFEKELGDIDRQLSGFDFREIENVIHDGQQMPARRLIRPM